MFLSRPVSIDQPVGDVGIAVDAAVAQEGPVASDVFQNAEVDLAHQNFLVVVRGLSDNAAERVAEKGASPEFKAISRDRVAPYVSGFMSHSIYHSHEHAIGNGMGALNGSPSIMLRLAELSFLRGMPADRRRKEEHQRALQRGMSRAFRIPLVPAN